MTFYITSSPQQKPGQILFIPTPKKTKKQQKKQHTLDWAVQRLAGEHITFNPWARCPELCMQPSGCAVFCYTKWPFTIIVAQRPSAFSLRRDGGGHYATVWMTAPEYLLVSAAMSSGTRDEDPEWGFSCIFHGGGYRRLVHLRFEQTLGFGNGWEFLLQPEKTEMFLSYKCLHLSKYI